MDLRSFSVFAGLTDFERTSFVSACKRIEVREGYDLIVQRGVIDRLYFVVAGAIRVHLDAGGADQELAAIAAPCVVGEIELFLGEEDYEAPASVTALEPSTALVLPYKAFKQRLAHDDLAAFKIAHNLAKILAGRLHAADARVRAVASRA